MTDEAFKREVSDALKCAAIGKAPPTPSSAANTRRRAVSDLVEQLRRAFDADSVAEKNLAIRAAYDLIAAMQADAAPVVDHPPTSNPVVDHETGNTSDKLRDAVEVWWQAETAFEAAYTGDGDQAQRAATAIIEADRQATRAALVAEIVEWMRGNCMSGKWRVLASEIEEKWGKP